MRRAAALLVLALLAALAPSAGAAPKPATGTLERGTYPAVGAPGARDFALYVPAAVAKHPRKDVPLVVYLHGCNQDAADVALGTRLTEVADEHRFLVLFPEQRRPVNSTAPVEDGNGTGCWNWFLPEHQARGAGEPATLAGMTQAVGERFAVDDDRVFVAGASAGADMATILAAAYPDVYAAVAPIAGCAYRTCSDADGAAALAAMGEHARVVPAFVVQGTVDMVNNAAMGATALEQWLGTDDLADDGAANGSVPQTPTRTTHHDLDAGVVSGEPGDPCVGSYRLPCAGGAGLRTYPYTELRYEDADGRSVVEAWLIHGANHAYTGGDPEGTFVDPLGPELSRGLWAFFAAHPRR